MLNLINSIQLIRFSNKSMISSVHSLSAKTSGLSLILITFFQYQILHIMTWKYATALKSIERKASSYILLEFIK